MFFIYAIYNRKYGKYYIGQTENLKERIRAHNEHRFHTSYTSRFDGDWILIYKEEHKSRIEALKRERNN
jgi:predicted GIY-YIG superfamily endonuclease